MSGIVGYPVPIGGVISLNITGSGVCTLSRSAAGSGGPFTTLYNGEGLTTYIDTGDGLPTPLASGSTYTYRLDDDNGSIYSVGIQPVCTLNIQVEPMLAMMLRLLQAGVMNLTPPSGVTKIVSNQVLAAMPLTGFPTLPIITTNLDRFGQKQVPIGNAVEQVNNETGVWNIGQYAERDFRVTILANNATDRDFYRDAVLGIFISVMRTVFEPIGYDNTHQFQVVSGQIANDPNGQSPGFYYADCHLVMDGVYNVTITPNYGLITTVEIDAFASGSTTSVIASG